MGRMMEMEFRKKEKTLNQINEHFHDTATFKSTSKKSQIFLEIYG